LARSCASLMNLQELVELGTVQITNCYLIINKKELKIRKDLHLVTYSYPYGKGEEFIGKEILVLANLFDTIYIYPTSKTLSPARSLPENVIVKNLEGIYNKQSVFLRYFLLTIRLLCKEFWHCEKKMFFISHLKRFTGLICYGLFLGEQFKFNRHTKGLFYSYWMFDGALALSILRYRHKISNFVFRVHGADLYDERVEANYMPFRTLNMQMADAVFTISDQGYTYLVNKNIYPEKVQTRKLGVFNIGTNPFDTTAIFTVVSCSNLIPLKRVSLLIEALALLKKDVKWIHFGDGPLKLELIEQCKKLPANISYEIKGYVANDILMKFYKENSVNLFVNLSETEGIPVSILEAMSFGIPILATDVGGTAEAVTLSSGSLLPKDCSPALIAEKIERFRDSNQNTTEFRNNVKQFWAEEFDAEKNYQSFAIELSKIDN
jgi:glycosyltransferase involved in cell wall biosynthesis